MTSQRFRIGCGLSGRRCLAPSRRPRARTPAGRLRTGPGRLPVSSGLQAAWGCQFCAGTHRVISGCGRTCRKHGGLWRSQCQFIGLFCFRRSCASAAQPARPSFSSMVSNVAWDGTMQKPWLHLCEPSCLSNGPISMKLSSSIPVRGHFSSENQAEARAKLQWWSPILKSCSCRPSQQVHSRTARVGLRCACFPWCRVMGSWGFFGP